MVVQIVLLGVYAIMKIIVQAVRIVKIIRMELELVCNVLHYVHVKIIYIVLVVFLLLIEIIILENASLVLNYVYVRMSYIVQVVQQMHIMSFYLLLLKLSILF